jgi:hypothetical protein
MNELFLEMTNIPLFFLVSVHFIKWNNTVLSTSQDTEIFLQKFDSIFSLFRILIFQAHTLAFKIRKNNDSNPTTDFE